MITPEACDVTGTMGIGLGEGSPNWPNFSGELGIFPDVLFPMVG